MSHFASTETDCNLDAVAVLQKLFSLIYFCFKVVRIDLQGETDLFNFHRLLFFLCFLFTFGLLKAVLAIVHDLAHRRHCFWRNIDQIQVFPLRNLESFLGAHNSQRAAVGTNYADFLFSDFFIDRHFLFANGKAPPKHLKSK